MNFYDCFMYYDEDMLLDLRLNVLNNYVKKFVITESTYLHNGRPKTLKFDIKKFSKFKDKIKYIIVDKQPANIEELKPSDTQHQKNSKLLINALKRENFQRNRLQDGLSEASDEDLVIISDVDEIPNLENFTHKDMFSFFKQKMFYYKFNLLHKEIVWVGSRACKKKYLLSPQWLRNIKNKSYQFWRLDIAFSKKKYRKIDFIDNGGWHFSSIKSPEDIHFKMSNFLHHREYEVSGLGIDDMEKMVNEKKVLYNHSADKRDVNKWAASVPLKKVTNLELPKYLRENIDKYKVWLD